MNNKYLIIEKIHRYLFIICALMLCVEYNTNILLTAIIGLIVIGLAFLNPIPFLNQILLLIPFLIRVVTHRLLIYTWILFITLFILWTIMLAIIIKEKISAQ